MPCILYHGSPPERAALRAERMPHKVGSDFPVVVTTYEIVMRDLPALKRWHWKYIVVDEVGSLLMSLFVVPPVYFFHPLIFSYRHAELARPQALALEVHCG